MSGWYTSAMNYDMMSPNPWNTMNLHMNQLWDHSSAWNNMFSVPQYSFDNFMPYGNMYSNSYLTNPMYTLGQMSWGTPMWNSMPWNNNGNMGNMWGNMWGNMGWNGNPFGQSNGSGNGNGTTDSATNRKYNRLLTLMKQMVKAEEILSASQIDTLNDAMKNTKGTTEEKYERLLEAYNEIDKETVRDFLKENGHALGVSSDVKGQEKNKDTFYNRLLNTGYDYETELDDEIDDFYDDIKTLKGNDGKADHAEGLIGLIKTGTYDILDFVSSWNDNYKDDSDSSRVIDHIAKYYKEIDDKDQQKTARSTVLKPLVDEMIDRANSVKKSLDKDSKEAIEKAIAELREAMNNTKAEGGSTVDSDLSSAFDKVYLYARQGAVADLRNDAKAYYGEIDPKVFNDKLFRDELIEDLESEGFASADIEGTEVTISERRAKRASGARNDDDDDDDNSSNDNVLKDIDQKASTEQVSILKAQGYITELTTVKHGEKTLYQENKMTGDSDNDGKADYAKLFYINDDGNLVEWKDAKLDADKNLVPGVGETAAKASDIVKGKKEAEKAEKEEKTTTSKAEEIIQTNNNSSDKADGNKPNAWRNGEKIADKLIGYTTIKDRVETDKLIMAIKDKDVFVTLAGYGDDDALGNDIIAQIVTEGKHVPKDTKEKWIRHILDCVVKNLTAQVSIENKKETINDDKIQKLNTHISTINNYLNNLSTNIENKTEAKNIDKILKDYIKESRNAYEDHIWIAEAAEAVGNFFNNLFDWG